MIALMVDRVAAVPATVLGGLVLAAAINALLSLAHRDEHHGPHGRHD